MTRRMKPFFPYFGSKYRISKRYPEPTGTVIEPFAGSACYSTYWGPDEAILIDLDENIFRVWDFLISATPQEIRDLPDVYDEGDSPYNYDIPSGASTLIGFWLTKGAEPSFKRGAYASSDKWRSHFWRPQIKERIATQLPRIKNWKAFRGPYEMAAEFAGGDTLTFVDPPYVKAGKHYRVGFSDYEGLAKWCQQIPGTVIVCEGEGATWLPFKSLGQVKSFATGTAEEKVWIKE